MTTMLGATLVYTGFVTIGAGVLLLVRKSLRKRGLMMALGGAVIAATGFLLPAREMRRERATSRLDEFFPRWQFHEVHRRHVAASPERVFAAVREVRANEILLFRALTWIRRGGRDLPESILHAGDRDPLLDVATRAGFLYLADDEPRELVIGTAVVHPRDARNPPPAEIFQGVVPSGYALAAMNFAVTPDGSGGSIVTTETRVYASDPHTLRRFRTYWRLIYPGSALIRRMWLRAIERRATR